MPPTSPSSRRATDGLSFFWSDLSRHYPGDQGDREFLWRFTVPSDTSSLNLSDCQRRRRWRFPIKVQMTSDSARSLRAQLQPAIAMGGGAPEALLVGFLPIQLPATAAGRTAAGRTTAAQRRAVEHLAAACHIETPHPAIAAPVSNSGSSLCPTTFLPIASPPSLPRHACRSRRSTRSASRARLRLRPRASPPRRSIWR